MNHTRVWRNSNDSMDGSQMTNATTAPPWPGAILGRWGFAS